MHLNQPVAPREIGQQTGVGKGVLHDSLVTAVAEMNEVVVLGDNLSTRS